MLLINSHLGNMSGIPKALQKCMKRTIVLETHIM